MFELVLVWAPLTPSKDTGRAYNRSMVERPPSDPCKLIEHVKRWEAGDDPPGRTLANLKTGGLGELLTASGDEALEGPWQQWEQGRADPADVLAALTGAGLVGYLTSLLHA